MFVLHPFQLVPALLVLLAASRAVRGAVARRAGGPARVGGERGGPARRTARARIQRLQGDLRAAAYAGCRQVAEIRSPRGLYALLDDFTERVDTDISNNAGMLGVPGPPQSYGLYRDGSRIAALPKPGASGAEYAPAELDALPYKLLPHASVLLAGASGGFAIQHALALGAMRSPRSSPIRCC